MIRINLLGVERTRARKAITFDIGQRLTLAAGVIVAWRCSALAGGIGR